jgi:hypothetical protein
MLAAAAIWNQPVEEVSKQCQPREREYRIFCEIKEQEERLLEYCREHGITGKRDGE